MPQIFSADAQQSAGGATITAIEAVTLIKTNPLQPPFQTCKAKVFALAQVLPGADQTTFSVFLIRNPQAENLIIGQVSFTFTPPQTNPLQLSIAATDQVPDPRQVTYSLVAQQAGGADNGVEGPPSYIEATLISG